MSKILIMLIMLQVSTYFKMDVIRIYKSRIMQI